MADLVKMVRADGEVANVRPDWIDDWRANGWRVESEEPPQPAPRPRGRPRKEVTQ